MTKLKYKIVDNFLPKENIKNIKELLLSSTFPYFFHDRVAKVDNEYTQHYFYCHTLFLHNKINSDYFNFFNENYFKFLDIKSLIRVKINMYPSMKTDRLLNDPHIDYSYKHKGALLYVNTCNGSTILKDKTKITSVENRVLFFDPSKEHDVEYSSDVKVRINIQVNYF